jgi:hypothetical protein
MFDGVMLRRQFNGEGGMPMYLKLIVGTVVLGSIVLAGCVSHEAHLKSDAEVCSLMGHPVGSHDYDVCMKALNQRRCEDRSSRDPMCQHPGAK